MNVAQLQAALNARGAALLVDGIGGPKTRAVLLAAFVNKAAPAITSAQIAAIADRLGVTVKQVRAVAAVESGGSAFDANGRPKILFERHYFHRLTGGKWSVASFSNSAAGGYSEDSWGKLAQAACKDPDAAFSSASWGRFQVMGAHWSTLGYDSPFALAWSTVVSEAAHYELLARFIEANGLQTAMRALSPDPATCAPFAKGFNGTGYAKLGYHKKLAEAMR